MGGSPSPVKRAALQGDPLDALGDPNRRAILQLLRGRARSVREIASRLPITRPAVSRHLRILKEAALVRVEADGTRRFYELDTRGVEEAQRYMKQVWGEALVRFKLVADNTAARSGRRR